MHHVIINPKCRFTLDEGARLILRVSGHNNPVRLGFGRPLIEHVLKAPCMAIRKIGDVDGPMTRT